MRWFRGRADKQFKNKYRVKNKPSAPEAPKPKYKSPSPTKRVPKLRKPKVDLPFVDACMKVEADSWVDVSPQAVAALKRMISSRRIAITKISWVLNAERSSRDDDGWCQALSSRTWTTFEALWAAAAGKPEEYRRKDERRRGRFPAQSIMGVSHAGCECHLSVELSDGSVYGIYSTDPTPAPMSGPAEDVVEEQFEGPESEEGPEGPTASWMDSGLSAVSFERIEDELGAYGEGEEEESLW